jgi:Dolichyl-phosphate-mannose-protein mannosyltransferase
MARTRVILTTSTTENRAEVKGVAARFFERRFWGIVAAVIVTSGTAAVLSALRETQTWDEGIHLSAGYAYLTRSDFRWNQEHPPLAKLLSALPLLFFHPELPVSTEGWRKLDETQMGIDFLYHNRASADLLLFAGRSMTMLLSLLFLVAIAWLVRRRLGPAAALLTVTLCAFDPNLIAHARYVTTDFPVTVFSFLTALLWMEYLLSGRPRDLVLAAVAFALALVTKFSALLLLPALAILYVIRWWQEPSEFPVRRAAAVGTIFAGITLLTVAAVYWPETLRCVRTAVPPLASSVKRGNLIGEALYRSGRWFHLPEHAFLAGLGKVAEHNQGGHASYLLGMRSDKGWWYYFPVVFAVKSTMAALAAALVLLGAGMAALRRQVRAVPFVWFGLLVPPVIYFVFSMTSAINIGMRHILPVYPFLYVAVAVLLCGGPLPYGRGSEGASEPQVQGLTDESVRPTSLRLRYALILLPALQIAECASIFPDYLAFFNAISGGPGNGPHYLVDSNIDWGQDVKKLREWLRAHGTDTARIWYFGNAQMDHYGIRADGFPDPLDEKGWNSIDGYAVSSVTVLEGVYVPLNQVAPLRLRDPIAKVGWSMYVYDFRKKAAPSAPSLIPAPGSDQRSDHPDARAR